MDQKQPRHIFSVQANDSIYLPVRLMQVFVRRNCAVASLYVKHSAEQQGLVTVTVEVTDVERPEQMRRQVAKLADVYGADVVPYTQTVNKPTVTV